MTQDLFSPAVNPEEKFVEQTPMGLKAEETYQAARTFLAARFNELLNSPDHIPVLRTATVGDKTALNQGKVGSAIFSNLLKHNMSGIQYYNCESCRNAFRSLYQFWFRDKNGAPVSPVLEMAEKFGIPLPHLVPATDKTAKVKYSLIRGASTLMANAESDYNGHKFTHFYGLTQEQLEELHELSMPDYVNARNIAAVCDVIDDGLDPENIHRTLVEISGSDTALKGLLHIKEFSKFLQGCVNKEIRLEFVAHFLRLDKWAPLRHFCSSVAGNVFTNIADGMSIDDASLKYLEQTDPVKYKQRTAEVAAALFVQTRRTLEETGALDLIARKTAIVGEDVKAVWSLKDVAEENVQDPEEEQKTPNSVFDKLISNAEKQKSGAARLEQINEQIRKRAGDFETRACSVSMINARNKISLQGFLAMLEEGKVKRMALTVTGHTASKICTASTEINASEGVLKWVNASVAQQSLVPNKTLIAVATSNSIVHTDILRKVVGVDHIPPRYFEVSHIAKVGEIAMIVPTYARMLRDIIHVNGETPTILGGEIVGEYYGMSGAIRKASQEIGLQDDIEVNSSDLVAGFLFGINDTFVIEYEDGSVDSYLIASAK